MDGSGFWRLLRNPLGESATQKERRDHRMDHAQLIVWPSDTETLEVIRDYHATVVA